MSEPRGHDDTPASDPRISDLPDGWAIVTLPDAFDLNPPKPRVGELLDRTDALFVPMPAVDADVGAITAPQIRSFVEVRFDVMSFRGWRDRILGKASGEFDISHG